jgi:hypothetical protein
MNRENTNVPPPDEQDAFWQWVLSFADGAPDTQLITPDGEIL